MDIVSIFQKMLRRKLPDMNTMTTIQIRELKQELATLAKFSKKAKLLVAQLQKKDTSKKKLDDAVFEAVTTRNKLLISSKQQQTLAKTTVGFFGLSVGSHAALTWMMLSRAAHIKISDPDTISPSNLNRLRVGWTSVGSQKIEVTKKLLLDMHPYAFVQSLSNSEQKLMYEFCCTHPKVDCIVDEIDDLKGKIMLRKIARKLRVPLISAVDVGENVLVDIERYDLSPKTQFFLGRLPRVESINLDALSGPDRARLIISLVGLEHNSTEMLESLLSIGKDIGTWPQLGSTATIAGGIVATTIKRIVLGEPIKSGRYVFDMDGFMKRTQNASEQRMQTRLKQEIRKRFQI